ncbi:MAG: hypothetical protein AAFV19_20015 [Pseudomonadota bacterium]
MQASAAALVGLQGKAHPLRDAFLRWQCRVRQMMMRDDLGRPGDAIMPALTLAGADAPMGHIITVMSKTVAHAKVPEMRHMAQRTQDPASRREAALKFFSEFYYQKGAEFSDTLTATFPPDSPGAAAIREAGQVTLDFDAFRQHYSLTCRVWRLAEQNPLWQATYWHNMLFNPGLTPDTVILAFEPDWDASSADPSPI